MAACGAGAAVNVRGLTLVVVFLACSEPADQVPDARTDTLAPIGTGTERLLTDERLALVDGWIRASMARTGEAPASIADVRPPESEAARYAPLERYFRDGWGRRIEYERDARRYELRSAGEDGKLRTADDITVLSSVDPNR